MELKSNTLQNGKNNKTHENGIFGILTLGLIIYNAFSLHSLLILLSQRNNLVKKLWEPDEVILYLTVPTFIFVCLIIVWIISPKSTQMKQIFKIAGIIGIILYIIYLLIIGYLFALGSGMRN